MTIEELQAMWHKPIRVCKDHRDSFSTDCAICKLERARNEMVTTFWYLTKCCDGQIMEDGAPLPQFTNEEAMKVRLDHILMVASTMVDRYGNPDGKINPWPRTGSKGCP
jgi:hypothetical protein